MRLQQLLPGLGQFPPEAEQFFRNMRARYLSFYQHLSMPQYYEVLQSQLAKELETKNVLMNRKSRCERAISKLKQEGVRLINENLGKVSIAKIYP